MVYLIYTLPFLVLLAVPSYHALDRDIINLAFTGFKAQHHKQYANLAEEERRAKTFESNLAYIEEVNSKNLPYKLGVNEYADLTFEEFTEQMLHPLRVNQTLRRMHMKKDEGKRVLQASVDWRTEGVLNPIKNQGQCGSCWSFSANGALEAQYAIATGNLLSFSEQQLNDCSSSYGNNGCNGGLMHYAFEYIQDHGVSQESTYPYEAADLRCDSGQESNPDGLPAGVVTSYNFLSSTDSALMGAISDAPVAIAVYANQDFQLYSSGIFTSNSCGRTANDINHAIIAVGYGSANTDDYYIMRNSWGTRWGENGYMRVRRGVGSTGVCNILSYMVVPTLQVD